MKNNKHKTPESALSTAPCSVSLARMTHSTTHFNKNQKVWLQYMTGAQAAKVKGKFRGRGRYVSAWIQWNKESKPFPKWVDVSVPVQFATKHELKQNSANTHRE